VTLRQPAATGPQAPTALARAETCRRPGAAAQPPPLPIFPDQPTDAPSLLAHPPTVHAALGIHAQRLPTIPYVGAHFVFFIRLLGLGAPAFHSGC
jgi:hypothetical protein